MKTQMTLLMIVLSFLPALTLQAQEKKEWTSPEAAAKVIDFQFQGEYLGSVVDESGVEMKVGLQLIALGGGTFRGVSYVGGLPGAGWSRGYESETHEATLNDQKQLSFKMDDGDALGVLKGGTLTVTVNGEPFI